MNKVAEAAIAHLGFSSALFNPLDQITHFYLKLNCNALFEAGRQKRIISVIATVRSVTCILMSLKPHLAIWQR